MSKYVMSIDAETDGLWGRPFAIAAILYDQSGTEIDKFTARIPNSYVTNPWVQENVLPTLEDLPVTSQNHQELLEAFAEFWHNYRTESTVVWHMGHIVEANLFKMLHNRNLIGDFEGPYTPVEMSTLLLVKGHRPDSVDAYAKEKGLEVSDYGSTHNPLYDCEVAARVYFDLIK